jgi:hypothetical protein
LGDLLGGKSGVMGKACDNRRAAGLGGKMQPSSRLAGTRLTNIFEKSRNIS